MDNEQQQIDGVLFLDGGALVIGYQFDKTNAFKVSRIVDAGAWIEVYIKKDGDSEKEYLSAKLNPARVKSLIYEIPKSKPVITVVG